MLKAAAKGSQIPLRFDPNFVRFILKTCRAPLPTACSGEWIYRWNKEKHLLTGALLLPSVVGSSFRISSFVVCNISSFLRRRSWLNLRRAYLILATADPCSQRFAVDFEKCLVGSRSSMPSACLSFSPTEGLPFHDNLSRKNSSAV